MKCIKCDGIGTVPNNRYYNYGCAEAYERGLNAIKKCSNCKGSGFIIGNVKDVLNFLKHLAVKFEHDKEYLRETKQCIDTIENL